MTQSPDDAKSRKLHRGTVKWFDPTKGFGFVLDADGGSDILLHANVLRNFGQSSVADGSSIEIEAQVTERGVQAVEIVSLEPPQYSEPVTLSDLEHIEPEDILQVELEAARVKWFDKGKGFGFVNVYGKADDVFVHVEVLRRSGLADPQPGEAVTVRAIDGRRGQMAVEVAAWEAAID